jgi:tetratricopeptide (TPR) repeat protein
MQGVWSLLHGQPSHVVPVEVEREGNAWAGPVVSGLTIGMVLISGRMPDLIQLPALARGNYSAWSETVNEIQKEYAYKLTESLNYISALTAHFREVLNATPSDHETWFRFGAAKAALGDLSGALTCYDECLRQAPLNSSCRICKAACLAQMDRVQDSLRELNIILESQQNEYALLLKGILLARTGETASALESHSAALEINPDLDQAWFHKALLLDEMGEHVRAFDCYLSAVAANPNFKLPPLIDRWLKRGCEALEKNDFESALAHFNRALLFSRRDIRVFLGLAKAYTGVGDFGAAKKNWLVASEFDNTVKLPWLELTADALKAMSVGDFQQALTLADRAIEADPDYAPAWFRRGVICKILGKLPESRSALERATELDPGSEITVINLADVLAALNCFKDAARVCDAAIGRNLVSRELWFKRAAVLAEVGRYEEALQSFIEAGNLGHPQFAQGVALCNQLLSFGFVPSRGAQA